MSMLENEILERIKRLQSGLPPVDQPNMAPPPMNQQPYLQAEALEQQAAPPEPRGGWAGIGEAILRGLAGSTHPGGYHAYQAQQQAAERQRQQDLLSRAQRLRQEGMARDQMNVETDRFNAQQSMQQQRFGLDQQQHQLNMDQFARAKEVQNRPQFKEFGTAAGGTRYGQIDPATAQFTQQGEIPGATRTATNINQARDLLMPDGKIVSGYWNEDVRKWVGVDSGQVLEGARDYHQPAASIQMGNTQRESVPEWVNLITSGQADLTDAPYAIRSDIVRAASQSGNAIVPKQIRDRLTDLQSARNLLGPVKDLVAKIKRSENVVQNSLLLENYTRSVGTALARQVGQERGVATDQDVARAIGLVPGWKSTNFAPGYADEAMSLLEDVINRQDRALREGYFQTVTNPNKPSTIDTNNTGSVREQFSRSTNQYRHSLDGGKTWQPGRAPQK